MIHEWLVTFIAHRIADQRIVRLIRKWLKTGVLEDGKHMHGEMGSPQGASFSPLAANIYWYYVFDFGRISGVNGTAQGDVRLIGTSMASSWGSRSARKPSSFTRPYVRGLRGSAWSCTRENPPDRVRPLRTGATRKRGLGKPQTFNFWVSRTEAGSHERDVSDRAADHRAAGARQARGDQSLSFDHECI